MADHQQPHYPKGNETTKVGVVTMTDDRGLFDFLGKEEVKPKTDTNCNMKNGEMEEIHCGSSSSSDDEEGGEKKKKGLKEKMVCHGEEESEVVEHKESPAPEEKKGIIEKIKEKLPGQHKNDEVGAPTSATPPPDGGEPKEQKKGFMEKIKEKLPGYHKNEEDANAKDI